MTITKALNHFHWKLSNIWKATDKDVEAYQSVLNFVKDKHEKQLETNQLFAKLYVYVYGNMIRYYNSSVLDQIPQKELHKLLDKPLDEIINDFKDVVNSQEISLRLNEKGITTKHPILKSEEEKQNDLKKINLKDFKEDFSKEEVTENLTQMINLALNEYA